ncbi:MAG: hypothetical protein WKF84_14315 [Pyrinomonadaceae bacterium]
MLWVILVYSGINLFLLGLGLVIGFLLHLILPAVDLGIGILIGVITTGFATNLFSRLNKLSEEVEQEALVQEAASMMRAKWAEPLPPPSTRPRKKRSSPPRRPVAAEVISFKAHEDD